MKLPTFFIKHPVISIVLNAMILIIGLLCLDNISVREYPDANIPSLSIRTHYPNASPDLVESSVTNLLEDQLAGVEGLETIKSFSEQGVCIIDLSFQEGTSVDRTLIAVREAIGLAKSLFPKEVLEPVVQRKAKSDGVPFITIAVSSHTLSFAELTHQSNVFIKNAFRSIKGVASAEVWGQPYTMTITLNPQKMYAFGVNVDEVYKALEQNNVSWPVGKFREQVPVTLDLTLSSEEDFENLLIKENKGTRIFLKMIADVELKTDNKNFRTRINGKPGLVLAISKTSDCNPLDVSDLVRQQVAHLQEILPKDISVKIDMDQTDFIRSSLSNIKHSIFEAILLVLIIVFLFLRTIRATIIPLITIPISLIGAVILIKICGFSVNTITLLAMVLAIGLVVDDAIVVLENIARHIENGISPLQAALMGSREIGFAIVAMTLTLASVYAPIAFVKGAIGQLFIEFAVALAGSVVISGIVALTLSPMMCSKILKEHNEERLWPAIDTFLKKLELSYDKLLIKTFSHTKTILSTIGAILIGIIVIFSFLPRETAPKEDRGIMGVYLPTIPGKDLNELDKYILQIEEKVKDIPEAASYLTFMGNWGASVVVSLKPHSKRSRSPSQIAESLKPYLRSFPSIDAWEWSIDSGLPGVDDSMRASNLQLVLSTVEDYKNLFSYVEKARKDTEETNIFSSVSHDLKLDTPGYSIHLDNNAMSVLGITPDQVAKTIEIFFSGQQSLFFKKDGIRYAITLQGQSHPWTLNELYITNPKGKRISVGTIADLKSSAMPKELFHYNQMRSVSLNVSLKPDQKIASSMTQLWDIASKSLPSSIKKEWSGAAKVYLKSSMTMILLFSMALVFIYAILTVQFENFIDPLIIMITVPLGCLGALFLAWISGQSLNIYTQIGLITLIGLITKHGILIVEFANKLMESEKKSLNEAVRQAALLRLRPILMTTGAMIFGSIPLILSMGAGSEARRAIGIVLVGGLSFGTLFTLFVLPKMYYLIKSLRFKPLQQRLKLLCKK